jgi:hypothetical protein
MIRPDEGDRVVAVAKIVREQNDEEAEQPAAGPEAADLPGPDNAAESSDPSPPEPDPEEPDAPPGTDEG